MLSIEKTTANVSQVKLDRGGGVTPEESRHLFAITLALTVTEDAIDDLAPGEDYRKHFWDSKGTPQMVKLYPLKPKKLTLHNHGVTIFDKVSVTPLELEGVDITGIQIEPLHQRRAKVCLTLKGVAPEYAPNLGSRLWDMVKTPVDIAIQARQEEMPLKEGDHKALAERLQAEADRHRASGKGKPQARRRAGGADAAAGAP